MLLILLLYTNHLKLFIEVYNVFVDLDESYKGLDVLYHLIGLGLEFFRNVSKINMFFIYLFFCTGYRYGLLSFLLLGRLRLLGGLVLSPS